MAGFVFTLHFRKWAHVWYRHKQNRIFIISPGVIYQLFFSLVKTEIALQLFQRFAALDFLLVGLWHNSEIFMWYCYGFMDCIIKGSCYYPYFFLLPSFSKYSGFIFKSSVLVLLAVVLFHVSRVNHKSPAKFGSIADLYINENES